MRLKILPEEEKWQSRVEEKLAVRPMFALGFKDEILQVVATDFEKIIANEIF